MKRCGMALLSILLVSAAMAAVAASVPDPLIRQSIAQLTAVKDYTCDLTLNARLPNAAVSGMRMKLYYKRPGRMHVEAKEGFAVLPEEGVYLGNPLEEIMSRFTLKRVGEVRWEGQQCVAFAVRPKADEPAPVGRMRLYVNRDTALPAGFSGQSAAAQVTTVFSYQKVQGRYWLPARMSVRMVGLADSRPPRAGTHRPAAPRSPSPADGANRNGTATLVFSDYRINTGLPDSLFVEPARPVAKVRKYR